MITLRRSNERLHSRRGNNEVWLTFYRKGGAGILAGGFGNLESLDEGRLPPRAGSRRQRHRNGEVVTYVQKGALAFANSMGHTGVVHAGEFHRMTAGSQVHHREMNASHTDSAHVFQIGLRIEEAEPEPSHEQKRFSVAQRRGRLCLLASPDARRGSLRVHQSVLMYSAMLHPGQHVVHELVQGRSAWIHVVQGQANLGDVVLTTGDGAGVTAERAVSLTAQDDTEILLLDLDEPAQFLRARSGSMSAAG